MRCREWTDFLIGIERVSEEGAALVGRWGGPPLVLLIASSFARSEFPMGYLI